MHNYETWEAVRQRLGWALELAQTGRIERKQLVMAQYVRDLGFVEGCRWLARQERSFRDEQLHAAAALLDSLASHKTPAASAQQRVSVPPELGLFGVARLQVAVAFLEGISAMALPSREPRILATPDRQLWLLEGLWERQREQRIKAMAVAWLWQDPFADRA